LPFYYIINPDAIPKLGGGICPLPVFETSFQICPLIPESNKNTSTKCQDDACLLTGLLLAHPQIPVGGTEMPTKAAGGEVKEWYLTMGATDAVVIAEGPNDETAATLALAIGAQGSARTQTMRAFTEAEYCKLTASLP
jgi:hypothetical protein